MAEKRRWTMPVTTLSGERLHLVVMVPSGDGRAIHAGATGRDPIVLQPEDISRLRRIFQEAQAVALRDRGGFE